MKKSGAILAAITALMMSVSMQAFAQDDAAPAAAAEGNSVCEKFYHSTADDAEKVLHNTTTSLSEKQTQLGTLFDKTVDSAWVGRFVLGRFWNGATPDQKKEYLKLYAQYLKKIYVSKFDGDDMGDFEIKLASITPMRSGDFDTRTIIKRPGQADVHVNYVLNEAAGKCHVHDITVENVSLLSSQRSEFQTLAGRSGIDGVMDALKTKVGQ